jgi:glycosyltransferase involved in cell wall biosynthesis
MAPIRSPSGLADALARVLTDETLADRLRKNAFERYLASFTKADMVRITIEVMRDLDLRVPPCVKAGGLS